MHYRPLLPTHGDSDAPVQSFMVPYPSGILIQNQTGLCAVPALDERVYLAAYFAHSKGTA